MDLQLAEFRQIGRARDLGRAAAALWGRRRASRRGTPRRRSARWRTPRRRSAGGSGRRTSRRRAAPVWKSTSESGVLGNRSASKFDFYTALCGGGPLGTPLGGGPRGGAPLGAPGGGPLGGGPRGGGPRPLPPGPRGGGPRLWKSTSNHEVRRSTRRFSTKIRDFFFYTGLCGGAPLGGGPRGGGPLGGGPRGGGPRGGPPMVFYVACSRSLRRGLRPAAVLYDAPAARARRSTRAAT